LRDFSFLSKISKTWAFIRAFERFPCATAPWTVFSGSLSLLAWRRIQGIKILYCHTPPRMLFDLKDYYQAQIPVWSRPIWKILCRIYEKKYRLALSAMDIVVANSENVRRRLKNYFGRESIVVYPPCNTQSFCWQGAGDFFLSTARVDPLKRVDLIVQAFALMPDKRLVVVSGGSDLDRVKAMAAPYKNIEVLGWVDESWLQKLMGTCLATVYIPIDEDFGISPVESMACGKPVLGVAEGGLLETMGRAGQKLGQLTILPTGIHLPPDPSLDDVQQAVRWLSIDRALAMRGACERRSAMFSEEAFPARMAEVINGQIS
jgi:glycosyltransferase involved in cell wall biosynthesis